MTEAFGYVSVPEGAKRLGISRTWLLRLIYAKKVKAIDTGTRVWLISLPELERFAKERASRLEHEAKELRKVRAK